MKLRFRSLAVLLFIGFSSFYSFAQEIETDIPPPRPPAPFSPLLKMFGPSQDQDQDQEKDKEGTRKKKGNKKETVSDKASSIPCLVPGVGDCPAPLDQDQALSLHDQKCMPYNNQNLSNPSEERISPFEAYLQGQFSVLASNKIHPFGYDLFERPPSTFAPSGYLPVGPDYLLGPGDELLIALWGKINFYDSAVIDPEGAIIFPNIGILHIAGLTFAEAKKQIENELSRYYRPSEVRSNISMGRLRSLRVYVVGRAACPGSYTLSSFSSLLNAVLASGGATKSGTLRDIQVKRNGKTVAHFDLYDFLLKGDNTQDLRLMPEDVIWIPSVGPLVGILGYVKVPAIYELKEETRLLDLIEMAGGLTALAFRGRVQVQRVIASNHITYFEGDLTDMAAHPEKNLSLQDGDIVRIFPVIEEKRVVTLTGAVGAPGEFAIQPGITKLKDLIMQAGGLLYYASEEGTLTRVHITQEGPQTEYIPVNFKKALQGDSAHNLPIEMNDYIVVQSVPEWQLYRRVELKGEVRFPGQYTIKRGEILSSLLTRAGGFTDKAYLKGAILTRQSVKQLQKKNLREAVDRMEQRMLSGTAGTLEAALSPESALIQQKALEQRRALLEKLKATEPIGRLPIVLTALDQIPGTPSDIPLEDGDRLVIPEKPSDVQVLGAVYNVGSYLYEKGTTVSDYIQKAGGMGRDADKSEIYILKIDGTAVSRRQMGGFFVSDPFMNLTLDAGDAVVVPEEIEKIAWLREFRDISQILYNIAVTAGIALRVL